MSDNQLGLKTMPLDDLVSVIETLQQRIRDHGASLRENETRTRMALIDPLLTVLGWDVANPVVASPEYNAGNGRADYALLGGGGRPAALIEAKHLGDALEPHRMQMLNYSNASGVEYAGLTDGDRWELYEVFKRGQLQDRRILDVSVSNTPAHELALKLLLLWRRNLASGEPVVSNVPILGKATISLPGPNLREQQIAQDLLSRSVEDGWIALADYNPPPGSSPPTVVRFVDGQEIPISNWKQMPIVVADWLFSRGILTNEKLPIPSGRRGFAANFIPRHRDDSPMVTHATIADGQVFINVHVSARAAWENSKKLLHHCDINPAQVHLKVE